MSDHPAAGNVISNEEPSPMPTRDGERDGEWIVPDVSYVEPGRRFCAYCGRPIARRYWRERTPASDLAFCQPVHAERYEDRLRRTTRNPGTGGEHESYSRP